MAMATPGDIVMILRLDRRITSSIMSLLLLCCWLAAHPLEFTLKPKLTRRTYHEGLWTS